MKRVIVADGDWDVATEATWQALIFAAIDQPGVSEVVLDMSDVRFLGSTGLSVLSRSRSRAELSGVRFVLRSVSMRVVHLLTVTGMLPFFVLEPGV